MKIPRYLLLPLLLGISMAAIEAADVGVKVIALFADKALLQVGNKQKIVSKGETFEGVLLESSSARGAVVVIDGKSVKLGLNQSIAGKFKKPDRSSLKIYPDSFGMYYTRGAINGQPTRFLVDTGATFVTMSGRKARQLKIDFLKGIRSTTQTATATVPVWQITLDSVSIGGIKLPNVEAIVINGDQPSEVLLGNSFLAHTRLMKAGSVLEIKQQF